jgi:hypothetical protein
MTLQEVAMFERNEGVWDRALRVTAGLGLLSLVFVGPTTWLGLIGLVPLVTGIVGHCPLYRLIGLTTCQKAHPA